MKELDFSKFKKVKQDQKSVILRHPGGHEIKVALSGLTTSMKKKLADMPIHKAEGEEIIETPAPEPSPNYEPAEQSEPTVPEVEQPSVTTEEAKAPEVEEKEETPIAKAAEAAKAPEAPVAPQNVAQAPATPQPQPQAAPQPIPPPPLPTAPDYEAQDIAYARELLRKEIKPETYSSMFGKKDTLGKIGTIFGLLVSGAGSGLTHQPNALLEMMNKEIERDIEAQKKNRENAHNFLNLTYQHEMQRSQQQRMAYENELLKAQTGAIPTEIALKKAQIENLPVEARLKLAQAQALEAENAGLAGLNRTKNNMLQTVYQDLANQVQNNPQGQAVLQNQVAPAMQTQMQKNNAEAAAKIQVNAQQRQQEENNAEPVNMNRMNRLINLGRIDPKMPGAIPPDDVPQITKEANELKVNRNLAQQYADSFAKLNSMVAGGRINKNLREAEVESLAARIARESGVLSTEQAKKQVNGMFPAWDDWGQAREEKFRKSMEHFKGKEAHTNTLERYHLKSPFPDYTLEPKKKSSMQMTENKRGQPIEGQPIEKVAPNGKTALFDPASKKFLRYKDESVAAKGR